MKNIWRIWVVAALCMNVVFPQVEVDNFGEVMVQINDRPAVKYYIGGVDLYKNVSIDYDTTLQVQEKGATVFYYYPQLDAGEHYVLHMILNNGGEEDTVPYDFYVDLGNSINGEVVVSAADSNLFINPNGRFTRMRLYAHDHNGTYRIESDPISGTVNGAIQASFQYPAAGDSASEHFSMEGTFKIPTQNVQEGDATNIASPESKDSVFRNLAYAAIGSLVIVLMVLAAMTPDWRKVIAHVDMDAFFAAIEQLEHPELRGKPVIVGADPRGGRGRGVVSTASYEARPYGVHSAMPISRAYQLCPHGIYRKPDGALYASYSRKIFAILEEFTPLIQVVSVDEAFLDVSGSVHLFGGVAKLGAAIKDRIHAVTGLTASVGISNSKSVAKIASDYQKPDGLTVIPPEAVQDFLDALPVTKLWGAGKKTVENLARLGIVTVRQLREYPLEVLEKKFGKMGPHLHRMARGIDEREVVEREAIKSVSHETTFGEDHNDRELLNSTLLYLAEKVSTRLRKKDYRGKTIHLKLRFEDFSTFTRNKTLAHPTNLTEDIYKVCKALFEQFGELKKPVRLIGVGVSHLVAEAGSQTSLWDVENQRKAVLEKVMDQLQEKFGKAGLTHAETLTARKSRRKS